MPTGSGKTLVAIMTILKIFDEYDFREHQGRISQLSIEEIHKKNEDSNVPT
jgi:replicative superfamily II helicase